MIAHANNYDFFESDDDFNDSKDRETILLEKALQKAIGLGILPEGSDTHDYGFKEYLKLLDDCLLRDAIRYGHLSEFSTVDALTDEVLLDMIIDGHYHSYEIDGSLGSIDNWEKFIFLYDPSIDPENN